MSEFKEMKKQLIEILEQLGVKPLDIIITYGTIIVTFDSLEEAGSVLSKMALHGLNDGWSIVKEEGFDDDGQINAEKSRWLLVSTK